MADKNEITIEGHIGDDAEIRSTQSGAEVASFSVATDNGYKDKTGEWKKVVNWHKVFTFEPGFVSALKKRGTKGARVLVRGQLEYRKWRKEGEDSDRQAAEIKIGPFDILAFPETPKADAA
jgi:single-strand DNA-binding protein